MEEKIIKLIKEQYEEILEYDGENMVEDGVIDSFTVLNLVNNLEQTFDIEIPARFVRPDYFKNKESIITLVNELAGGNDR